MYPGSLTPAPQPRPPAPPRRIARPVDPIAAVLGNATLLGIGYMMMRRPRFSAAALSGTGFLLFALASDPGARTWPIALGVWWAAMTFHARWLTRKPARAPLADLDEPTRDRRQRYFAGAVAGLVLLSITFVRVDAWMIVRGAENAHTDGDCSRASELLERLDANHRVAYGSMAIAGGADLEACRILVAALGQEPGEGADTLESYMDHPEALWDGAGPQRAEFLLATAREGADDPEAALEAGFEQLTATLGETPGQSERVREVVEVFFSDLAERSSHCKAKRLNDWIYSQDWEAPELAEPIDSASVQVADRLVGCARYRSDAGELEAAKSAYDRFLADYPDHEQAGAAADELYVVETAIEYANVEELLGSDQYCDDPSPYRAAPAYRGKGPHAMQAFGIDPDRYDFPKSWQADNVDDTVLVLCVDGPEVGEFQEICTYRWDSGGISSVAFFANRFDIKAYELRTGELVADYSREIGNSCPDPFPSEYHTIYYTSTDGHPSTVASEFTSKDVREMFYRLMD